MAIVWACPLSVERYAEAGPKPAVPRQRCPSCLRPMGFWWGYERFVRDGDDTRRIWVRRAKRKPCGVSHALLPAFVLPWRFYATEVIGAALARMAAGDTPGMTAKVLRLAYATVRDWRYRWRARAPTLAAGFSALAVSLGAQAPACSADPQVAAAQTLGAAWTAAKTRLGDGCPPVWRFAAVVTGGGLLAATTAPSWTPVGGWPLLPPAPFVPDTGGP